MPNYKYSAVGSDGRTVSGKLDAANKNECVAELRRRALTPIDVQEKGGGRAAPAAPAPAPTGASAPAASATAEAPRVQPKSRFGSLGGVKPGVRKREEVVIFTRQLATMIGAGIPMLESLEILQEQAESRQFSALLEEVIGDVRWGQAISTGLDWQRTAFNDVHMSV